MKYTIMGFNQQKAVELKLNVNHLLILSYFRDFRDTELMVTKIFDGKPMYWLKYEAVIDNLPILGTTSRVVLRRYLKQLEDAKVLTYKCEKTKEGTYTFYGIGEKYLELQSTKPKSSVAKIPSNKENSTTQLNSLVPTELNSLTGLTEKFNGGQLKSLTGSTKKFNQNINLLKDNSIKNTPLLENREPSSEPYLFDSDNRAREIIKETLDSMSDIAYDMWFKNTTIKEYEDKVSIRVSKELFGLMPSKYIKQIEITLDKPIELIKET